MSRVEENEELINGLVIASNVNVNPLSANEDMAYKLGIIAASLLDISKNLAILADSIKEEK